ncbi:MAG: hypothetical protein GXP28_11845 [Planctomycetes bacterium]|nr:hypothetical protein [Planctomycetota bacterium]
MNRKNLMMRTLLAILLSGWSASFVVAAPLNVANPGFEDISGEVPTDVFTFGPFEGWDLYDPNGITGGGVGNTFFVGTLTPRELDPIGNPGVFGNYPAGAPEGERVALAFNSEGSDGLGEYGLVATLEDVLQPNTTYTLQIEIGNIASGTSSNGTFFELSGFPGYRVDLLAGVVVDDILTNAVVIAQDNNTLSGAIDDGEFATSTVSLTIGATHPQLGQTLGIRLVNLNQIDPLFPDSHLEVNFDDVRLDASPAGDFDQDGDVDGADFLAWQRGFPAIYNGTDLLTWETNFGTPSSSGSALFLAVPEPTALALSLGWFLAAGALRRIANHREHDSGDLH